MTTIILLLLLLTERTNYCTTLIQELFVLSFTCFTLNITRVTFLVIYNEPILKFLANLHHPNNPHSCIIPTSIHSLSFYFRNNYGVTEPIQGLIYEMLSGHVSMNFSLLIPLLS